MRKYSFGQIIGLSWKRMALILFKPYNLKKWIMLLVIIALAGYFTGMNFNFNPAGGGQKIQAAKEIVTAKAGKPAETKVKPLDKIKEALEALQKNIPFIFLLILVLVIMAILIPLWLFIRAVFHFVFIESLIRNDASVRIPFHKNKVLGTSYFYWNVIFGTAVSVIVFALLALTVFSLYKGGAFRDFSSLDFQAILTTLLPYLVISVIVLIIAFLIRVFAMDFVTVIMYYKNIGIKKAWAEFIGLFKKNTGDIILYLLVKLGLNILNIFVSLALVILAFLFLLVIGGIAGLIGWAILSVIPAAIKTAALIILLVIGVPFYVFLLLVANSFFVPIPVFFRLFPIYFLAGMEEPLDNLLKQDTFLTTEEEIAKYKKPLFSIWAALLLPLLAGALLIAAIFVGGLSLSADPAFSKKIPFTAGSATLYLNNGRALTGVIEKEDKQNVTIRIRGGSLTFNREDIQSIKRDNSE